MRTSGHRGWWEPDILRTAAQLQFLNPTRPRTQQHAEIMAEVVTFSWLGEYDRRRASAIGLIADRLERLGMRNADPEAALIVLWQATLWHLAAEIDAPATAGALEGPGSPSMARSEGLSWPKCH